MIQQNRLAKALGSLSIAADHGAGQPIGTALQSAVIAVRLGRKCKLSDKFLKQIYYGTVLSFIGCTSTMTEAAMGGHGEEAQIIYSINMSNWRDPIDLERSFYEHYKPDVSDALRAETIDGFCAEVDNVMHLSSFHCQQAILLASRLPLPYPVEDLFKYMYSRWDGNYAPGLSGTDIPIDSQIVAMATNLELFRRAGGIPSALQMVKQRSGHQFDPALCAVVEENVADLFHGFKETSEWDLYLDAEPEPFCTVKPSERVEIAQCFADYVDQKSGWFHGHSRQVASVALRAAREIGLDQYDCDQVYVASLIHDIGRIAVPNRVWEKEGPLSLMERREAESHSYHTESIVALAGIFDDVIGIAESAHERRDSSGYHRRGRLDGAAAGCLAASDVYNALTNPRPWRGAMTKEEAATFLLKEVTDGRLPLKPVQGVLKATGQECLAGKHVFPAGLTEREVDLLGCLVRGMSNKQISVHLGISEKTAENHLSSVYKKTEVAGRAPAALYALKHEIFTE
jgi:HD-GYP domain-containing protein (c-di-GMP phosphodiesterase class II)/DNA-binding CsgD family transcriptional regulator